MYFSGLPDKDFSRSSTHSLITITQCKCVLSYAALQGASTGDDIIREILSRLEDLAYYSDLFTFVCALSDLRLKDLSLKDVFDYVFVLYLKDTHLIYLKSMQIGSIYVSLGEFLV